MWPQLYKQPFSSSMFKYLFAVVVTWKNETTCQGEDMKAVHPSL